MPVLEIKLLPDPILRKKASPLEKVSEEVKTILNDMAETMYDAPGIGLAGNQVGILMRLVVMDCSTDEEDPNLIKMINPEIIPLSSEKEMFWERCLSLPGLHAKIPRYNKILIKYYTPDKKLIEH